MQDLYHQQTDPKRDPNLENYPNYFQLQLSVLTPLLTQTRNPMESAYGAVIKPAKERLQPCY